MTLVCTVRARRCLCTIHCGARNELEELRATSFEEWKEFEESLGTGTLASPSEECDHTFAVLLYIVKVAYT